MRYVKIVTLSIFVLFITSFNSSSNVLVVQTTINLDEEDELTENGVKTYYTWDSLITRIKSREGLMLEPYNCAAGYQTIGYGHLITERDSALIGGITEKQADSLLRKDLNYSKKWVKNNLKLKGTKLIAITNFCFAFGTAKLYRSTLYKKIQNKEKINEEILRWININGLPNPNLQEEREFELWLYTANDKKINSIRNLSQSTVSVSKNQLN
ncbi:phage-related lysozyme (muraminidase) [Bernardetia litoralis DSM 6794]|uniref:Lysozyme n=1 Tax=Bernardetia litoralis (strain ATCC 23117 / DSM 6794 / NBRC 15988 / NCIMB 1366 / Fx l1 / Sio-4) TaxID=880071 RepID=I4AIT0_BERLS|nr:lysozyme [Bernardetia litoralis]AFM03865.1 phage-related lysozyme (muraminidase) [Bernardetia litoralis DSM 6794]